MPYRKDVKRTMSGLQYTLVDDSGEKKLSVRVDKDLAGTSEIFLRIQRDAGISARLWLSLTVEVAELEHLLNVAKQHWSCPSSTTASELRRPGDPVAPVAKP
jgi:hypothetical protein